jgi:hypothetical protein
MYAFQYTHTRTDPAFGLSDFSLTDTSFLTFSVLHLFFSLRFVIILQFSSNRFDLIMGESTAARRVWGMPQLRDLVIKHMSRNDLINALGLSTDTFPDVFRVLYRRFDYKGYPQLFKLSVPV